VHAVSTK